MKIRFNRFYYSEILFHLANGGKIYELSNLNDFPSRSVVYSWFKRYHVLKNLKKDLKQIGEYLNDFD